MYGKTGKSAHYLPRTGSYSTVPHRNGRVDVLPADSKEALFDPMDTLRQLQKRFSELRQERDALTAEIEPLARMDELKYRHMTDRGQIRPNPKIAPLVARRKEVKAELKKIDSRIQDIEQTFKAGEQRSFENAFVQVAKLRLSPDVWRVIFDEAMRLSGKHHGKGLQSLRVEAEARAPDEVSGEL